MQQSLKWKSILYGFIATMVVALAVALVATVGISFYAVWLGLDDAGYDGLLNGALFLVVESLLAVGIGILGGYIAARHAGFRFIEHGAWVGGIGFLVGLIPIALALYTYGIQEALALVRFDVSTVLVIFDYLAVIPAGIAGGYVAQQRFKNQTTSI